MPGTGPGKWGPRWVGGVACVGLSGQARWSGEGDATTGWLCAVDKSVESRGSAGRAVALTQGRVPGAAPWCSIPEEWWAAGSCPGMSVCVNVYHTRYMYLGGINWQGGCL